MSRPGNTSSRCCENSVSIDITSSKWPCFGQSFTIRILPSRSMMVALISPTFSFIRIFVGQLAVENLLADFRHALGAERVGGARPAQRRLGLLVGLEQRLIRPLRRGRWVRLDAVKPFKYGPDSRRGDGDCLFHILHRFMHHALAFGLQAPESRLLNQAGSRLFALVLVSYVCGFRRGSSSNPNRAQQSRSRAFSKPGVNLGAPAGYLLRPTLLR